MTVKELITELQKYPDEYQVIGAVGPAYYDIRYLEFCDIEKGEYYQVGHGDDWSFLEDNTEDANSICLWPTGWRY